MASPAAALQISPETAYIGVPPPSGDGVWTAPPFHATWYVLSGAADIEHGRERWRVEPGHGIVLPSRWRRFQRFAPGTRLLSLGLRVTWPDGTDAIVQAAPIRIDVGIAPILDLARAAIATAHTAADAAPDSAARAGDDPVAGLRRRSALDAYAAAWLEALLASGARLCLPETMDTRLQRLRAELIPRFGAIDWGHLNGVTGLSRSQLDRLCHRSLGVPVRGLRDRLLLDRVRALLAEPGRNLAGIAREVGASDASHLVKWFRRGTGRTPGEERRWPAEV